MIQTAKINMRPERARELHRAYLKHRHYSTPIDDQIRRAYREIARGNVVIQVTPTIKNAGVDDKGLPRLAICRADAEECAVDIMLDGRVRFTTGQAAERWATAHWTRHHVDLPAGTFPRQNRLPWRHYRALVPIIPIHLRPKRGLANYHILWEAEWERVPPRDPLLLRRLGKGDLWLVVAAWDLTEIERAALAGRMTVQ